MAGINILSHLGANSGPSQHMMSAIVPLWSYPSCRKLYNNKLSRVHMCAGGLGTDTCQVIISKFLIHFSGFWFTFWVLFHFSVHFLVVYFTSFGAPFGVLDDVSGFRSTFRDFDPLFGVWSTFRVSDHFRVLVHFRVLILLFLGWFWWCSSMPYSSWSQVLSKMSRLVPSWYYVLW